MGKDEEFGYDIHSKQDHIFLHLRQMFLGILASVLFFTMNKMNALLKVI